MVNPAQFRARPKHSFFHRGAPFLISITLLIPMTLLLGGCSLRKRPSISWANAVQVKPTLQARAAGTGQADLEVPELNLEMPPFAALFLPVRAVPPRPRVASSAAPAPPVADPERPEAVVIAPQLTQEESAAARQETNQSLNIAEKNLAATRGKTLNASQSDLVSKIKGFLKDAREAAQAGDWARARSLAKKAQVLSEELLNSV